MGFGLRQALPNYQADVEKQPHCGLRWMMPACATRHNRAVLMVSKEIPMPSVGKKAS